MNSKHDIILTLNNLSGCSLMVEPQPSKLTVWVRFPSPAPNFSIFKRLKSGCSLVVKHHLAMVESRVRSPSPAPFFFIFAGVV